MVTDFNVMVSFRPTGTPQGFTWKATALAGPLEDRVIEYETFVLVVEPAVILPVVEPPSAL